MHSNQTFSKVVIGLLFLAIGLIAGMLLSAPRRATAPTVVVSGYQEQAISELQDSDLLQDEPVETQPSEETMLIEVPTEYDFESGEVIFKTTQVAQSPSVLNSVLENLFDENSYNGTYNGYTFDSVSIQNGLAQVNLSGSYFTVGDMSMMYFRQFIEAAVFQYDSVDSLQVYINGELFDWCIDDSSNGETSCPGTPYYWSTQRN